MRITRTWPCGSPNVAATLSATMAPLIENDASLLLLPGLGLPVFTTTVRSSADGATLLVDAGGGTTP